MEQDIFMQEFKRFRQLDIQSDEFKHSILSAHEPNLEFLTPKQMKYNLDERDQYFFKNYGLKDLSEWRCYELKENPGLFIIPNPFRNGYQRYFIKKCLGEYHNFPNKTNLDLHIKRDHNLWEHCINKKDLTEFNKLRWATIGYHYDWTQKVYDLEYFNEIPIDVKNICELISKLINFDKFVAQAGIVNYYHLNSTLSAHQDVAEFNMKAPLISLSLGSSAVFQVGDMTKTIKPNAILVQSGDIVVMSGDSRLSYHAVPKIFKNINLESLLNYDKYDEASKNSDFFVNDKEWLNYFEYIKINRINLNIRQVFD